MKRLLALAAGLCLAIAAAAQMPKLDDLLKGAAGLKGPAIGATDDKTGAAGIKEALAVGTENAVKSLGRPDGYFANEAVKILMPEKIRKVSEVARMAGFQRQVDEFVLSMNRAAEAAAPLAAKFFGDAIRDMTLEDVRGILSGGDTAATDFFSRKTRDKLYAAFKPVVAKKVGEVGATRAYTDMMGRFDKVPMMGGRQSLDLDDYVTNKSLDGLFRMVGEEEKKIRTNPAARTTDLLRTVFGR
ncbi:MAG: DUF4197 domain-containing protein [Burkholderiales bacterium]|nr:DUF4197 domain-containing protein [Burkholderiales bacterium]